MAVSYTWDGNDARYDDPTQWTPSGVPGDGDTALISSGMPDLSGLTIGATSIILSAAGSSSTQSASGSSTSQPGNVPTLVLDGTTFSISTTLSVLDPYPASEYVLSVTGISTFEGMLLGQPATGATSTETSTIVLSGDGTLVNDGTITLGATSLIASAELDNEGVITMSEARGATSYRQVSVQNLVNDGSITDLQGPILVNGTLSGTGTITLSSTVVSSAETDGAGLDVLGPVGAGQVVDLVGAIDSVQLGDLQHPYTDGLFAGTIQDFDSQDTIFINSSVALNGASFSSNELTLTSNGTPVLHLHVVGSYAANAFYVGANPPGSNLYQVSVAACYATGTRILTARGAVPVEELVVGDRALTVLGQELSPIRWIGHRALDLRRHPTPELVRPVRIRAGAFGEGRPMRDLVVSPGHAVYVDDVLIQAERLLNGVSIVQEPWERVTYWHVELERHDVLLAEGLPAESYLDTGNRTAFSNGGAFLELHPDFRPREAHETCAPLVQEGVTLERVKARLLDRARDLFGVGITEDAEVYLLVDGVSLQPCKSDDGVHRFDVPAGQHELRLCSRTWVPAWLLSASTDTRTLGVCVRRLLLDGLAVPLDDARLAAGWHDLEHEADGPRRWTKDAAVLPAGTRTVEVHLTGFAVYRLEPDADRLTVRTMGRVPGPPVG